jgi:hypothetical protein
MFWVVLSVSSGSLPPQKKCKKDHILQIKGPFLKWKLFDIARIEL